MRHFAKEKMKNNILISEINKKIKVRIKIQIIIVSILLFTVSSCLNSYEKEALGEYELYRYDLKEGNIKVDNFSRLL